ncbi:MAG TPA: FkbM family methyltransferase [Burkholderiales bacterium]|nr:FkbM family methyltransferase [Burkholderiales bacterium]
MNFVREAFLERRLRGVALRIMRWVDRWDQTDLRTNGEAAFIRHLMTHYASGLPEAGIVVVDGGAHFGNYVAAVLETAASRGVPIEVHAFEPIQYAFSQLSARNSGKDNVILNNCALSDGEGPATMFLQRNAGSQASLYQRDVHLTGEGADQVESVALVRLDNYFSTAGVEHVHLLKLDVEGAEFKALAGLGDFLRPDFLDFVQFEYGGANLDSRIPLKVFFDLFEAKGFVVARLLPSGLQVRTYRTWMDNYAYANYVAVSRPLYERLVNSD